MQRVDTYGHCIFCGKNMIVERVVDKKVINMFTTEYAESEFLLDDGSRMRVCLCKKCKDKEDLTDPTIHEEIMTAVKNGWQREVRDLVKGIDINGRKVQWTQEKANAYMETYGAKSIDCHCEDMSQGLIDERKAVIENLRNNA